MPSIKISWFSIMSRRGASPVQFLQTFDDGSNIVP